MLRADKPRLAENFTGTGETIMRITDHQHSILIKTIFFTSLLSGCSTVNYDSQADQQITTITQEINLQLTTWELQAETTPVAYDTSFYDKTESDISTLEIRMESVQSPATDKLVGYFESLNNQLETMRSLHKPPKPPLPSTYFHAERLYLDQELAPLTTFELSLKNSSSSSAGSTSSTAVTTTAQKAAALKN
jgi:hypothetical protein